MTIISLGNVEKWTIFVTIRRHLFGNVPAQLDNYGPQVNYINWFL